MASWWERIENMVGEAVVESPAYQNATGGDLATAAAQDGIVLSTSPQDFYQSGSSLDVFMGRNAMGGTADNPNTLPSDSILNEAQANGLIYTWGQDQLREFQMQIVQAGIVDQSQIAFGARDAVTVKVWQQLVGQAGEAYTNAGVRMSPMDLLQEYVQNPFPSSGGGGGGGSRGPGRMATNPEDVRAFGEQVAKAVIGRGELTEDELAKVEAAWKEYEAPFLGHSTATPPGQGAQQEFMESAVRELDPAKADARKVVGVADYLVQKLRGQG